MVFSDYRAVLAFIAIGLFIAAMVLRDGGDLGLPSNSYDRYSYSQGAYDQGYDASSFQARYGVQSSKFQNHSLSFSLSLSTPCFFTDLFPVTKLSLVCEASAVARADFLKVC